MMDEKGGVDHGADSAAGQSGLLQEGLGPSFGEAVPARKRQPATCRCTIRKTDKFTLISTCFPTHHLIFAEDANNTLWTSGGGTGPGRRLAQPEDVRGDRRRGEVAGLDAVHPRHQRQRQARRIGRAEQPSIPRRTSASWRACTASASIRTTARSGAPAGLSRLGRARRAGIIRRRPRLPKSTSRRSRATARAAATSTATASSGRRWRAAISASFDRRKCKDR